MEIKNTNLVDRIAILENEEAKQRQRAEKWKALAASFHSGMSHIFQEYERNIDGRATPIIDTGGMYRCCVEGIKEVIKSDSQNTIKVFRCNHCDGVAEIVENTWKAVL